MAGSLPNPNPKTGPELDNHTNLGFGQGNQQVVALHLELGQVSPIGHGIPDPLAGQNFGGQELPVLGNRLLQLALRGQRLRQVAAQPPPPTLARAPALDRTPAAGRRVVCRGGISIHGTRAPRPTPARAHLAISTLQPEQQAALLFPTISSPYWPF